jgi:hypothetical protein
VIKGAAESDRLKKLFRRLFFVALLIILMLIGAMLGMGIVAGEAVKESKVPDCADSDSDACSPARLTRVGTVESFASVVYDLARAPTEQLAYLRDVTFYVDKRASAAVGAVVEATYKVAGAYKSSLTQATLLTPNGYAISLDAGSITINGVAYPVLTAVPTGAGRRLAEAPPVLETVTGRALAETHEEGRRLAAEETGSRRDLNYFLGAA